MRDGAQRSGEGGRRSGAGRRLVDRPSVLIWLDEAGPYIRAAEAAGLTAAADLVVTPLSSDPPDHLLAPADALLAWRPPARLAARAPRLRWMQSLTGGCEQWLSADTPTDAVLTCARGTHRVQMSEHILAALLLCAKGLAGIVLDQTASRWRRRVNPTLAGSTLSILGLGAIGVEVARLAAGLGMRVIGTKREARATACVERVHPPAEIDRVLSEADYLLLLLPSTSETRGIIDKAALARLKPTAWVLNFGRGDLVVDGDLVAAVRERRIAGAVLDVFTTEPLPSSMRSGRRLGSSSFLTSAACIPSATRSSPSCGSRTCGASWTGSPCCRSSIGSAVTEDRRALTALHGETDGMPWSKRPRADRSSRHREHHRCDEHQPPA